MRWSVVVGLQTLIVALLLLRTGRPTQESTKVVETGSDINGLYQTLSHEYRYLKLEPEVCMPNMSTINGQMET